MSDINKEQKRLYKRAKENDYYFKKNNELSTLNTSLRSQRDDLQNRINKAIELLLDKYVRGLLNDNEVNNIVKILKGDNK